MKVKIFLLLLMFISIRAVNANAYRDEVPFKDISFNVCVLDEKNGMLLPGISISIWVKDGNETGQWTEYFGGTDKKGFFEVEGVRGLSYIIKAEEKGYYRGSPDGVANLIYPKTIPFEHDGQVIELIIKISPVHPKDSLHVSRK